VDAVFLARVKFALTAGFHFLFPPLTIGLAWLIVWMMRRYHKTGDEAWGRTARFWLKMFAVTFAVGVVSGLTLEFQFGTNWSEYSRFVGDIFGAPLAAEGVLAFFLESTFVGVLLLGWGRVSRRTLYVSAWMVALGATLSAFWIIVANSWMQTPAGYEIVGGRAVLTDFWAAVFNPSTVPRYTHTMAASLVTGAMFVMGVSAAFLRKGRHVQFATRSMHGALVMALLGSLAVGMTGHGHAVQVARTQPTKLAAYEGLFETQQGAPLVLFGFPDAENRTVHCAVTVPKALSVLAWSDPDAWVLGLDATRREDWPPLAMTFYPFHIMVALGLYFIVLSAVGLWASRKGTLPGRKWLLTAMCWSMPLPFIANELGWIAAEVGRQPWIVYGRMRTADAASPASVVPAGQILAVIIAFSVVYAGLFAAWIYLLRRQVHAGPGEATTEAVSGGPDSASAREAGNGSAE